MCTISTPLIFQKSEDVNEWVVGATTKKSGQNAMKLREFPL